MSSNFIESQFSREIGVEMFIKHIIKSKTIENLAMLSQFSNFKDKRPIPHDITWESMKKSYGWGYAKGSRIHSLVTWIYIRSDIKTAIKDEIITIDDVLRHLILNEHYFIVEKSAINFLKSHCMGILAAPNLSEDEECTEGSQSDVIIKYLVLLRISLYSLPSLYSF